MSSLPKNMQISHMGYWLQQGCITVSVDWNSSPPLVYSYSPFLHPRVRPADRLIILEKHLQFNDVEGLRQVLENELSQKNLRKVKMAGNPGLYELFLEDEKRFKALVYHYNTKYFI